MINNFLYNLKNKTQKNFSNTDLLQEKIQSNSPEPVKQSITREDITKATKILESYKQGKKTLEERIRANEEWYRLRQWGQMTDSKSNGSRPSSGWLFNSIANKHADAMDNFPSLNVLPREESDKPEANILSSIIPVILDQNDFEETYSDVSYDKLISGTGCYGVFWDPTKLNGLGDISIKSISLMSLFWEPGITDIQNSKHLFHVELHDNEVLLSTYPELANKLSVPTVKLTEYVHDDTIDTSEKSAVVDWYYKKTINRKTVLHYVRFVNDVLLYASENDPAYASSGFYAHASYPFVFDPLYRTKHSPCGFGYVDIGKSAQEYIDRLDKSIIDNALVNTKTRFFVSTSSNVNIDDFADITKDIIKINGPVQNSVVPIQNPQLGSIYAQVLENKKNELKETTGNRDISTGGTTSGVTAASAIAAMQEASSKLSRDANKASYRSFRKMCLLVIELIRQFYEAPRFFRITGEGGQQDFVAYTNKNIALQSQGGVQFGVDMGFRKPLFDIEVTAQKQSPYSKMAQNELSLQFLKLGFFAPQMADQALACLEMMDFDKKEFVMNRIQKNATLAVQVEQLKQLCVNLAKEVNPALAQQMAAEFSGQPIPPIGTTPATATDKEALGGEATRESSTTKKARMQTAEATAPR